MQRLKWLNAQHMRMLFDDQAGSVSPADRKSLLEAARGAITQQLMTLGGHDNTSVASTMEDVEDTKLWAVLKLMKVDGGRTKVA